MKLKPGQLLYTVFLFEGKAELEVYVVYSIRRKREPAAEKELWRRYAVRRPARPRWVTVVQWIDGLTWVKLSKKHGDYGIRPDYDRHFSRSWQEGDKLPFDLKTTQRQAWVAFKQTLKTAKAFKDEWDDEDEGKRLRLLKAADKKIATA